MHKIDIGINTEDKEIQFDYVSAKKKLKSAMDGKITQTRLAEITGIPQGRISTCLNENNSDFFTFEQVYRICSILGLSMDEITGLKDNQAKSTVYSLSDACSALCDLHRIMPLCVSTAEIETITIHKNETLKPEKKTRTVLFSEYRACDEMIDEFKKVSSIGSDMLSLWENNYKEKHTNELKEYGFCSMGEHFYKWIRNWVSELVEQASKIYHAQIEAPHSHIEDAAIKEGVAHAELIYSIFERAMQEDLNILYNLIDSYIGINNIPTSSVEYIALNLFKKVYEEKHPIPNNNL